MRVAQVILTYRMIRDVFHVLYFGAGRNIGVIRAREISMERLNLYVRLIVAVSSALRSAAKNAVI